MKKITLLLFALFVLSSCSGDDAAAVPEPQLTINGYLLKKIISTRIIGPETVEYFYNGSKIVKFESTNGFRCEFTYSGNLITIKDTYHNNILEYREYFQYDAQQRITQRKAYYHPQNTNATRTEFTYNNDHTVTVKRYAGDHISQNTLVDDRKAFLLPNGDVDKLETYLTINGNPVTRTYQCQYDANDHVWNPITGYTKLKYWDTGNVYSNLHNLTSIVNTTTENSSSTTELQAFTYNSYGYPVTSTYTIDGDLDSSTQYFYQQP